MEISRRSSATRKMSKDQLAARMEAAFKGLARATGELPDFERVLQWDAEHGERPHISRSSMSNFINEVADPENRTRPFYQYMFMIGIKPAVEVDGVIYVEQPDETVSVIEPSQSNTQSQTYLRHIYILD